MKRRLRDRRDFVEITTAGILLFVLQQAAQAILGFIFWQFVKELWDKYCLKWWNKMWGKKASIKKPPEKNN